MKLVIGGSFQGKKEAACRLFGLCPSDFADGKVCMFDDIFVCRAISDFQEFIRRCMQEPEHPGEKKETGMQNLAKMQAHSRLELLPQELASRNPQVCIVSNEIGYGVVPIDARERAWRELTGRICCQIAENSDTVVRVAAGIPVIIKESGE